MTDPVTDPVSTSKVLGWAAAAFVGIMGFFGKRQLNRIDSLEKNTVDKKEYNGTISSIRTEIREGHKETQRLILDLYKNQK